MSKAIAFPRYDPDKRASIKVTEAMKAEIRELWEQGGWNFTSLGLLFGVSKVTIKYHLMTQEERDALNKKHYEASPKTRNPEHDKRYLARKKKEQPEIMTYRNAVNLKSKHQPYNIEQIRENDRERQQRNREKK